MTQNDKSQSGETVGSNVVLGGGEYKGYLTQFRECQADGLVTNGEFLSFEEHPEMLPAFPSPKMKNAIQSGEWNGIQTLACGRFGGRCSSKNLGCAKLRNS
jgi:hypothetical protein